MAIHKKHFFVFPWPAAAVDLYSIRAVSVDRSSLNLQLHGGGFQRGPTHPDSTDVAQALIRAILALDGVEVTHYSDTDAGCKLLQPVLTEGT